MKIEWVSEADAEELLAIYAPYVLNTAVSFEYDVPSPEEFRMRIRNISARLPYLKAVEDGEIIGYSYAAPFHGRRAYEWSAEETIYVHPNKRRHGTGRVLSEALEGSLRDIGILNLNACIAVPREEDPYLTMDSVRFHEKMGYSPAGTFHNSGYKFGRWYDVIWMEKMLGPHETAPREVAFGKWTIPDMTGVPRK